MPRSAPILAQGTGSSDFREAKRVAQVQAGLRASSGAELSSFGDGSSPRQRGSLNAPLVSYSSIETGGDAGKKVGVLGSMANLANAAIGAGVLAFPLAYQEAGLVLGPLLTVAFGLILGYTLHVISRAAIVAREKTGSAGSYQEIVGAVLGPRAEIAIIVLQAVYLTGCNVCMLMIIRDQVKPVLLKDLGPAHWAVKGLLPLAAWGICFPLSLIRDMSVFAWPSSLSQLGIFYSVGVVVWHYLQMPSGGADPGSASAELVDDDGGERLLWGGGARAMVSSLPLICFGFQCHLTFSLVYDSLADPTPGRIDSVAAGCMLLCAVLYIPMGVCGYLLLGDNATADVLADLSSQSGSIELDVSIARYCVAVKVACSYAMLCHVTKVALKDLVLGYGRKLSWPQHVVLTAVFVAVTMALAMVFGSDLQAAMAFSGILVVIMVAIFPGVLKLEMSRKPGDSAGRCVGWLLILFGIAVGVVSLVVEILKLTS